MIQPGRARAIELSVAGAHLLALRGLFAMALLAAGAGGFELRSLLVPAPGAVLQLQGPSRGAMGEPVAAVGLADLVPTSTLFLAHKRAWDLDLGTSRAGHRLLGGQVEPRWVHAAGEMGPVPRTLLWPVEDGWFVRGYGSGEDGYHLAVDVAANIGERVRASADGIVGYAGNDIRGYGLVVMLIHPGGLVTFYAHNSAVLVVAGQRVHAGQPIARVGSSGISKGPHVHYELIYRGMNCDPGPLFRPAIRHRNGKASGIHQASWDPSGRSEPVDCAPRRRYPHSRWVD